MWLDDDLCLTTCKHLRSTIIRNLVDERPTWKLTLPDRELVVSFWYLGELAVTFLCALIFKLGQCGIFYCLHRICTLIMYVCIDFTFYCHFYLHVIFLLCTDPPIYECASLHHKYERQLSERMHNCSYNVGHETVSALLRSEKNAPCWQDTV
jgi:hypothetical protein